jgi:hypothetical protein
MLSKNPLPCCLETNPGCRGAHGPPSHAHAWKDNESHARQHVDHHHTSIVVYSLDEVRRFLHTVASTRELARRMSTRSAGRSRIPEEDERYLMAEFVACCARGSMEAAHFLKAQGRILESSEAACRNIVSAATSKSVGVAATEAMKVAAKAEFVADIGMIVLGVEVLPWAAVPLGIFYDGAKSGSAVAIFKALATDLADRAGEHMVLKGLDFQNAASAYGRQVLDALALYAKRRTARNAFSDLHKADWLSDLADAAAKNAILLKALGWSVRIFVWGFEAYGAGATLHKHLEEANTLRNALD